MTRDEVFEVVREVTAEVLPEADTATMTLDGTLSDLGGNSIDRADIATMSMIRLGVRAPARAFAGVRDIRTLVEVLRAHRT